MHNIGIFSVIFIALAAVVCLRVKEFVAMPLSIFEQYDEDFASTPEWEDEIETITDPARVSLSNDKSWGIWKNPKPHRMIEAGLRTPTTDHTTMAVDNTIKLPRNSGVTNGTMVDDLRLFEGPLKMRAGAEGDGVGGKEDGKDGGGGAVGKGIDAYPYELTVKIPMVKQDQFGQWVFDPWAVTFGMLYLDTRFDARAAHTLPRVVVDSNPVKEYNPRTKQLEEVCVNKSTIYADNLVKKWLMRHLSKTTFKLRPFQMRLRKTMYTDGWSESCHTLSVTDLTHYLECQILRNQRMELQVPKYALQQKAIS